MDNASELHMGGMGLIIMSGNNVHYFLTVPHGKKFAQLKPCLGILVYESNEERIIQTGDFNFSENFECTKSLTHRPLNITSPS